MVQRWVHPIKNGVNLVHYWIHPVGRHFRKCSPKYTLYFLHADIVFQERPRFQYTWAVSPVLAIKIQLDFAALGVAQSHTKLEFRFCASNRQIHQRQRTKSQRLARIYTLDQSCKIAYP